MSIYSKVNFSTRCSLFFAALAFVIAPVFQSAQAQLRKDVPSPFLTTGTIVMDNSQRANVGSWANMLNMSMSHSYSVSFGSFGGQLQNLNAYTNHTRFQFSDRLTGQMDISLLHSPFGGSMLLSGQSQNPLGAKVLIQNASLTYKLNDRSTFSVHFSQNPWYGYGGYGQGGYGGFSNPGFGGMYSGYSPFGFDPRFGQP